MLSLISMMPAVVTHIKDTANKIAYNKWKDYALLDELFLILQVLHT